MSFNKVLFYGGIFLFGLGILSISLFLINFQSLEITGDLVWKFPILFTVGTAILFYMGLYFMNKSIDDDFPTTKYSGGNAE